MIILEKFLTVIKYVMAVIAILGGLTAMIAPVTPISGPLGLLYGSRIGLVLFGLLTITCGGVLLYGKIVRSRKWTGRGLMAIYMCFLFASLIQGLAFEWAVSSWLPNAMCALISGALFLRWKFKTEYIDPNHFKKEIEELLK